ncbi:hypothetical protein [Corticimicrobacter sp.]|uniref:DUF7878 domain-containing protein n=1 Tax=Corticimicrobacter sp. TaxID=2678536 RepID=UPI0032D9FF4D
MTRWLDSGGDFYYFSMDYEEGPIFSFVEKSGGWHLSSVWSQQSFDGVKKIDLLYAVKGFLSGITDALKDRGIDFIYVGSAIQYVR